MFVTLSIQVLVIVTQICVLTPSLHMVNSNDVCPFICSNNLASLPHKFFDSGMQFLQLFYFPANSFTQIRQIYREDGSFMVKTYWFRFPPFPNLDQAFISWSILLKMTISTSVWSVQHPNVGRNIQQLKHDANRSCFVLLFNFLWFKPFLFCFNLQFPVFRVKSGTNLMLTEV